MTTEDSEVDGNWDDGGAPRLLDVDRLVIVQERTCMSPEGRVQVETPL